MTILKDLCETPPPQPVAFTTKESVTALVGFPVRLRDVVLLVTFAIMPVGSVPDTIVYL